MELVKRLLTFIIGIPLVIVLVMFLPFCSNLALNIMVVLFSGVGAVEFSEMLRKKNLFIAKTEAFILGALAPAAHVITIVFNLPEWIIFLLLMFGAGWVLMFRTFSRADKMDTITGNMAAGFSILIYPGMFLFWIVKMTTWGNPGIILIFLFITFGFDSAAWLAGTLFGNGNRGIIPASPNKSIAGFIGGAAGSIIVSVLAAVIFPNIFFAGKILPENYMPMVILLGFCTGIAAAFGDLAESSLKRSCNTKDSGTIMFGRGGVLDSIDSIAVAAPVFFILYNSLFN